MKLLDVVLTREGGDVETLGPMKWTDLSAAAAEVCRVLMKTNHFKLSKSLQKASELGRNAAITSRFRN
jgi:hypothetical protein